MTIIQGVANRVGFGMSIVQHLQARADIIARSFAMTFAITLAIIGRSVSLELVSPQR